MTYAATKNVDSHQPPGTPVTRVLFYPMDQWRHFTSLSMIEAPHHVQNQSNYCYQHHSLLHPTGGVQSLHFLSLDFMFSSDFSSGYWNKFCT